ncbi:3320_t:CDS:10, partial [Funneliformis caledonium]
RILDTLLLKTRGNQCETSHRCLFRQNKKSYLHPQLSPLTRRFNNGIVLKDYLPQSSSLSSSTKSTIAKTNPSAIPAYSLESKDRSNLTSLRVFRENFYYFSHGMTNEAESTVLDNATKLPKLSGVLLAMQKQNPLSSSFWRIAGHAKAESTTFVITLNTDENKPMTHDMSSELIWKSHDDQHYIIVAKIASLPICLTCLSSNDERLAWDHYTSTLALSQDADIEIKTLAKRRKDEAMELRKGQLEEFWWEVEVVTAEKIFVAELRCIQLKNQVVDAKRHHLQFNSVPDQANKTSSLLISDEVAIDQHKQDDAVTRKRKSETLEENDFYDNYEEIVDEIQDNILIVDNINVRLRIEEWRKNSEHIYEIHKQDLLRYNIIDTISTSATGDRNIFGDIWSTLIDDMETVTSYSITNCDDEINNYGNNVLKNVTSIEKLKFAIKSNRSILRTNDNSKRLKRQVLNILKVYSKIDTIIKLGDLNLEFSVVEVSGPPTNPDHSHYVGDRNKIAKNLKVILNYCYNTYRGDFKQFRKIKVYGLQVYRNSFYIYSLSLPYSGVYYFKEEFVFDYPIITLLAFNTLPKFLGNLWRLRNIISSSAKDIISYIANEEESYDNEHNTDPNLEKLMLLDITQENILLE